MSAGWVFADEDAERLLWLAGIVAVSPRSITAEGASELQLLAMRLIDALHEARETTLA